MQRSEPGNQATKNDESSLEKDRVIESVPAERAAKVITSLGASFAERVTEINRWILVRRARSFAAVGLMVLDSVRLNWRLWPKDECLPAGIRISCSAVCRRCPVTTLNSNEGGSEAGG